MNLTGIGIILSPTFRAMAYLQRLVQNRIYPNFAIILKPKNGYLSRISKETKVHYFSKFEDFQIVLKKHKIDFKEISAEDCNDRKIIDLIKQRKEKYYIYTGGGILKEEILSIGKKFIHVHPGIVPEYRGSTCIYYSILKEDKCGATAFFMTKDIDKGDVIAKKWFKKPSIEGVDYEYDCHIRSKLLIEIIQYYIKRGKFYSRHQDISKGEIYFIIHPVLKHLAILSCIKGHTN